MKISIIVPVYNVEKYLKNFFMSLDKQEYENYEVIFINDGSTDNSLTLLYKYKNNDARIKIINQSNSGAGSARNKGLDIAKGDYILFCDPDDYLEVHYLTTIVEELKLTCPQVLIFGYNMVDVNCNLIQSYSYKLKRKYYSKKDIELDFDFLYLNNSINAVWNKAYNRKFLETIRAKFPLNRTAQDALFNYELLNQIDNLLIIPNCLYNYISERENSAQNISKKRYPDEYELLAKKISVFQDWDDNANKMISISIIDFWTTQIIKYKGKFEKEIINSFEYIKARQLLNNKVAISKINHTYKVKYLLYRLNLNKLAYFIYRTKHKSLFI